jgi:Flp pilus assembly protein TadG
LASDCRDIERSTPSRAAEGFGSAEDMQSSRFRHPGARLASALRRLATDQSAVAAVEFATVSPFLIAIVLVSVMTGVIYMARSQLDSATQTGARAVMVGTATNTTQLRSAICGAIGGFFNCPTLMINLNTYSSLSAMSTSTPSLTYSGAGAVSNTWGTSFGSPGSIMVLQVMYQFPMIGTSLFNLATQANGTDLLVSTAVFINE